MLVVKGTFLVKSKYAKFSFVSEACTVDPAWAVYHYTYMVLHPAHTNDMFNMWESVCLEKHIVRKKVYTPKNNVLWLLLCLIHQRLWPLWPLFTQWTDVLRQDLVKSRSSEMRDHAFPIALKFHRYLDSSAARCLSNFRAIRSLSRGIISSRRFETSRNY